MKDKYSFVMVCVLVMVVNFGHLIIGHGPERAPVTDEATPAVESAKEGYSFDDLLDAIEWVESRGDPWAIGDNGEAIGAYQIHKIYVDDCNRIWGTWGGLMSRFKYTDRICKRKSRAMVRMFLKHYGGTIEEMARKHNGGPNGHKKESTKPYWEKVKAYMERPAQ